ncbi:TPA: D-alanyl-D-alanine carboxypeptidase family protein [Streptococcus pyogenes]|uniref:D-alanyl-D-alanine carboxypeptidase n=1 Tax=Streptococcus pyogenes TaxID=1314 RepID=A0A5S4TDY0_STRPY|nr:serine hydrolase [Streptococcus pyogenes]HER4616205.1 D-alanyl-D-alanine carboxypeptidase [Streptococcus pyogenes NGAS535]HER4683532.1 D-alanyl-D-alanine carboxypeptidase [Streptococcus pyogenes NGAS358]HER4687330.1 D-alanyl-D-alanine carboxypeptidase [Streptococcus pyogenes NGAS364]HER4694104.1 D-alanyl-D-alanine carboxypeptidase [Streptococcus pyogenes NGAS367]HER4777516.1 D-alanyl-D-alanine carboxypeptidase [Streptococcus pyogenes NGAS169]
MTKRIILTIFTFICFSMMPLVHAEDVIDITRQAGYTVSEVNRPKSSIVVDANSSDILWQDNIDIPRDPASMSKMFTLYILFEELAKGKITMDTTITATPTDQAIANIYEISNNNIVAGVAYPIRDLITMTAVPSSNAATVMIANYLSNNDASAFIDRINATAKQLGMTNTHFSNASGAAAQAFQGYYNPTKYDLSASNITTARDLSKLLYAFLKKYPEIISFTNKSVVHTMVGTPYEEEFHTYNHSLPDNQFGMKGVDGLKTGSSPSAAFNAMITAKRGKTRLITIVMGVGDWSDQNGEFYRHPFVNALTEKGFKDSKTLSKKARQKLEKLVPQTKKETSSKQQHFKATKKQSYLERVEDFINHNHTFLLICLAIFIITILLLSLVVFAMGRQ